MSRDISNSRYNDLKGRIDYLNQNLDRVVQSALGQEAGKVYERLRPHLERMEDDLDSRMDERSGRLLHDLENLQRGYGDFVAKTRGLIHDLEYTHRQAEAEAYGKLDAAAADLVDYADRAVQTIDARVQELEILYEDIMSAYERIEQREEARKDAAYAEIDAACREWDRMLDDYRDVYMRFPDIVLRMQSAEELLGFAVDTYKAGVLIEAGVALSLMAVNGMRDMIPVLGERLKEWDREVDTYDGLVKDISSMFSNGISIKGISIGNIDYWTQGKYNARQRTFNGITTAIDRSDIPEKGIYLTIDQLTEANRSLEALKGSLEQELKAAEASILASEVKSTTAGALFMVMRNSYDLDPNMTGFRKSGEQEDFLGEYTLQMLGPKGIGKYRHGIRIRIDAYKNGAYHVSLRYKIFPAKRAKQLEKTARRLMEQALKDLRIQEQPLTLKISDEGQAQPASVPDATLEIAQMARGE